MNRTIYRFLPVAVVGAAVVGAVATPTADAAPPASLHIAGDLQIAPGVHVLDIEATGARDAHGTTTGTYTATLMNGRSKLPFQVKGPITCIWTHGDTASLVYPISGTVPNLVPAAAKNMAAVQITVRKGAVDRVGVMGPAPTGSFRGCAPAATPFRFDGDIAIT
ncbi:hypothetical protein [Gordonia humi]|uniref:Putative pyridoxine 5'-phosphate oxidase superfamily flavin-nucleotide-binding protein n=1 Tax=Gordonia humi TaxID=686429 RepID=A0A840ESU7_9ACTN|nr:hypothetical protein [Gordonia humi]MBB4135955.1 putative pyridoxine 5'-phosphate oxidase superfamily flavin-nucleotide-binding protein [Gordonia humi]